MGTTGGIKDFSGTAHRGLAEEICRELSCDLGKATTARFSDGRERARRGLLYRPTHMSTDGLVFNGAAGDARCVPSFIIGAYYCGTPLLRLRPCGQKRSAPRANLGQAG